MTSNKLPWIIITCLSAFTGYQTAKVGHFNYALSPQTKGDVTEIAYEQKNNPGLSKLLSLIFMVSTGASAYQMLKKEEEQQETMTRTTSQSRAVQSSATPSYSTYTESEEEEIAPIPIANKARQSFNLDFTADAFEHEEDLSPSLVKIEEEKLSFLDTFLESLLEKEKPHLLISSETGCGKTTFLIAIIKFLHDRLEGNIEFVCSSSKDDTWLGLHDQVAFDGKPSLLTTYQFTEAQIKALCTRLQSVIKVLESRQQVSKSAKMKGEKSPNFKPLIAVMDEWQISVPFLENYDKENGTTYFKQIILAMQRIVLLGREYSCGLWVFAQDHQVQNIGGSGLGRNVFNSGMQCQFNTVVLGNKRKPNSIDNVLNGKYALVSKTQGAKLWAEAKLYFDQKQYICYSDLGGNKIHPLPHVENAIALRLTDLSVKDNIVPFKKPETDSLPDLWAETK